MDTEMDTVDECPFCEKEIEGPRLVMYGAHPSLSEDTEGETEDYGVYYAHEHCWDIADAVYRRAYRRAHLAGYAEGYEDAKNEHGVGGLGR